LKVGKGPESDWQVYATQSSIADISSQARPSRYNTYAGDRETNSELVKSQASRRTRARALQRYAFSLSIRRFVGLCLLAIAALLPLASTDFATARPAGITN
jgi:hypothetical protein